jgi:hypothetical protein
MRHDLKQLKSQERSTYLAMISARVKCNWTLISDDPFAPYPELPQEFEDYNAASAAHSKALTDLRNAVAQFKSEVEV